MSIFAFGKKDILVVPPFNGLENTLSGEITYTKPSFNTCFSTYGFAFPLCQKGIPLSLLLDKKLPLHLPYRPFETDLFDNYYFLLIDHAGLLWKILVTLDEKGVPLAKQSFVDVSSDGWWVTEGAAQEAGGEDFQRLVGFLYTDPTPKALDKFWFATQSGNRLEWLKISEIVIQLNTRYPKPTTSQETIV